MKQLMAVSEAQNRILEKFSSVSIERVSLAESSGRVLAEDLACGTDLPPFNNSSMDGFALISADIKEADRNAPIVLDVAADIPAGTFPEIVIKTGQAARIMTGAPVPEGADAVVPIEGTDQFRHANGVELPAKVRIFQAVERGAYIRKKGEDVRKTDIVLQAQSLIRPQDIGLMASLGIVQVPVYRKVRVALITSGDELVAPSQELTPGKIRDSNSSMLVALLAQSGVEAHFMGIIPDDASAVREGLQAAVECKPDLILSTAGVSVGVYDFIRPVIEEQGQLEFWRADMRPGKPIAFGSYMAIPFIGLPGNPVSAFVGYKVFVVPALDRLAGLASTTREAVRAIIDEPIESDGRETYLRVALSRDESGRLHAVTSGHQGSGNLVALSAADGLAIIPAGTEMVDKGSELSVWVL